MATSSQMLYQSIGYKAKTIPTGFCASISVKSSQLGITIRQNSQFKSEIMSCETGFSSQNDSENALAWNSKENWPKRFDYKNLKT